MAVTLLHRADQITLGIGPLGPAVRLQGAGVNAQAHCAAHIGQVPLVRHKIDDWEFGVEVEFRAVGFFAAQQMPGKFDGEHLHAQAESQIGHLLLSGKTGRHDFAFDAPIAKAPRHYNPGQPVQPVQLPSLFQRLGADPLQLQIPAFA